MVGEPLADGSHSQRIAEDARVDVEVPFDSGDLLGRTRACDEPGAQPERRTGEAAFIHFDHAGRGGQHEFDPSRTRRPQISSLAMQRPPVVGRKRPLRVRKKRLADVGRRGPSRFRF